MEETMLLSDDKGNSMGDPMVVIRRYAWIVFFLCMFLMACLFYRDEIVNVAFGGVDQVYHPSCYTVMGHHPTSHLDD